MGDLFTDNNHDITCSMKFNFFLRYLIFMNKNAGLDECICFIKIVSLQFFLERFYLVKIIAYYFPIFQLKFVFFRTKIVCHFEIQERRKQNEGQDLTVKYQH